MPSAYDPDSLSNLLPIYYKRFFPYKQYYKWLSYGNVPKTYFPHREFSFTIENDVYLRYQSFKDQDELEKEIQKKCPHKIDIGAVFSFRPKDHRTVAVFTPLEKELVFDIDMTDYDEVRYCCSGTDICQLCWKYMTIAIKILDAALREDYGFEHILWVYSGRRGVHCWVCDASARSLSQSARTAVAEYLQVIRGGDNQMKKVNILSTNMHPMLRRAKEIVSKYFSSVCLTDQDCLGTSERWNKVLALIPDTACRDSLERVMPQCSDSHQRWTSIEKEIAVFRNKKTNNRPNLVTEIKLQLLYPRLDINVSKQLNHLLKSPFVIHPKTGRVCVPIDHSKADSFNPMEVPTISQLIDEVRQFDNEKADDNKSTADYNKTSMSHGIAIFEKFLIGLVKENAARRMDLSDLKEEF